MTDLPRTDAQPAALARRLEDPRLATAALLLSLLLTAVAGWVAHRAAQARVDERFVFRTEELREAIEHRMADYEQMLLGGVALFASSNQVTRDEWYRYVRTMRIAHAWPGIQGMGYSVRVPAAALASHVASVRGEGHPGYEVRPSTPRDEYHSIVYLEPFEGRNLRAFGFDMYSEPVRREAMARARDDARTAVSGIVTLVQETDEDVQRGFLMYLPVYRNGAPLATREDRRAALRGFVYSPFRVRDLMHGILGAGPQDVRFELFDGTRLDDAARFHDSHPKDTEPAGDDVRIRSIPTEIGGRIWTLRFQERAGFASPVDRIQPMLVVACGLCIDALLVYVVVSLGRLRRRAEALAAERTHELERSRRQWSAVSQSATAAIVTADRRGAIVHANPAACRLFGYPQDTLTGKSLASLWATHRSSPDFPAALRRVAGARRRGATVELLALRRNGSTLPVEVSLARWSVDGEAFVTAIARDVTERKAIERHKDDFLAMVSHEIRTPLTTVIAPLALLSDGSAGELPPTARRLVRMASQNAARLERLASDILDAKRLETGQLTLRVEPLELRAFAGRALAMNAALLENHGVTARLDAAEAPLPVRADADKLMQVVTNLLSNAAKFSASGSTVVVRLSRIDGRARLAVVDRGVGIEPAHQARIFDRFVQAPHASGRPVDGAGLGLAICRALVEGMGGAIGVHSVPGAGATFHVDLPLATQDVAQTAEIQTDPA